MNARKAIWVFSAIVPVLLCIQFAGATDNYCHDQESWDEWERLVQKYPNDMDVHTLHALRLGLCVKVERGDLTVEKATEIFERARDAIIEKKEKALGKSPELEL
jgi:hypothetical protein